MSEFTSFNPQPDRGPRVIDSGVFYGRLLEMQYVDGGYMIVETDLSETSNNPQPTEDTPNE